MLRRQKTDKRPESVIAFIGNILLAAFVQLQEGQRGDKNG
jgi:hypothetical protein